METHPEGRTGVVPQVVLHGFTPEGAAENEYGRSNIDGPTNITPYVTSVSWTHSTRAPFETIQLELRFPGGVFQRVMPGVRVSTTTTRSPATGFWVVLYLPNEDKDKNPIWTAIHWGYCTQLRIRSTAEPALGTQIVAVSVSCESWVGLLQRNSFFVAAGSNYIREGSSYDLRSWADAMGYLIASSVNKPPGEAFGKFFKTVAKQLLPNSLSSGLGSYMNWSFDGSAARPYGSGEVAETVTSKCQLFGDVIRVIHDRELCAKHAPARLLNHKAVTGLGFPGVGNAIARGTTWGFMQNTFFPSPHIECFPSLEWPFLASVPLRGGKTASDSTEAASAYVDEREAGSHLPYYLTPLDDALENVDIAVDWTVDVPAPFNGDFGDPEFPLGQAFGGANPCLIYRMRPTLFTSINRVVAADVALEHMGSEVDEKYLQLVLDTRSASELLGINQTTQVVAAAVNVFPNPWYNWLASEIVDVTWSYSEDTRSNLVFAKTPYHPESQMETMGMLGRPIVNNADVSKHGLRMTTIEWPFYPSRGVEQSEAAMAEWLTALNEEFWVSVASNDHGHFFGTGSVRGVYKPWIKAGFYTSVYWQDDLDSHAPKSWSPFVHAPIDDPSATPKDQELPGFTGYITSVTHQVSAGANGTVAASTTMQLERVAVAAGAGKVAFNYPPNAVVVPTDSPVMVDPDTGETVTGQVTVSEDGVHSYEPDPTPGGGG